MTLSDQLRDRAAWVRETFFSSVTNTVLTVASLAVIVLVVWPAVDWAFIRAVWTGTSREACLVPDAGACWPFIWTRMGSIIYGLYDVAERWRIDIVFVLGAAGLFWVTLPRMPAKRIVGVLMFTVYPVLAAILLTGGLFGLSVVPTERWGGLFLTLLVAVTGIGLSLPLGILLALGRQSDLPVIKWLCVTFIEVVRGVPLITLLFMASAMLPFFLPVGVTPNELLSALGVVAMFAAAYMAEVVRGGLQAIPKGQYEAARALGLGYWQMMGLIILPQALRIVIPGIVNTFIGLFKDTSLISIIGFLDLLGIIDSGMRDAQWATPNTAFTGYLFAGAVFWAFCFGMSRYSQHMERKLDTGFMRER